MLKVANILTILLLSLVIQIHGQQIIVPDTTAKKLGVKTAIKKTYFGDNKTPSMTYTEFYDNNGRLTKRTSFNNHFNSISIKEYFIYNAKGQLIKEQSIYFNQKDSTINTQVYSYNLKGKLDSNSFGKIKYKYDRKGRLIESIEKTAKPIDLKIIYAYDSVGRLKEQKQYFINGLESKTTWEYNDINQIVKKVETYYDSNNNKLTSEYEFSFVYNNLGVISTEYQKQTKVSVIDKKEEDRIYTYEYLFY